MGHRIVLLLALPLPRRPMTLASGFLPAVADLYCSAQVDVAMHGFREPAMVARATINHFRPSGPDIGPAKQCPLDFP